MTTFQYKAGLNNVGSYQVSGKPWITGSTVSSGAEDRIQFPLVAKSITVINTDAGNDDIRVHFNSKDEANVISGNHYVTLTENRDSITINAKCKEIYLSAPGADASYTVIAELTSIESNSMYALTGSGLTY